MSIPLKRSRHDLERLHDRGGIDEITRQGSLASTDLLGIGSSQGWAEKRCRGHLDLVAGQFPECGFALATFDAASQAPIKILFAGKFDRETEECLERSQWQGSCLSPSAENVAGQMVPQGFAALILASEENREGLKAHDGQPVLLFALAAPPPAVLTIWKSAEYGLFREPEIAVLRAAANSISTVLHLGMEFSTAQMLGLSSFFDRLDLSLIVVDQSMRMVHANADAAAFIDKGDYISVNQNVIGFVDAMAGERVRQLVNYLATKNKHAEDAEGIVAIRGGGGTNLTRCIVTVLRDAEDILLGRPLFALTLSAARDAGGVDTKKLRRHGFTPAEAELIGDLLKGLTVTQHAQERGIAVATARAHIKRAMMRIGVHRQADLIRHVMSTI